jgi:hypothetical protein
MRFCSVVMRERFRGLPSDSGMFFLIGNDSLEGRNRGLSVR